MKQPKLKHLQAIPYGGAFRIVDPLTGVSSAGLQFENLLQKMIKAREANGVPVGLSFADEVEKWACLQYPEECEDTDPNAPKRRNLTLTDVINGTRVMVAFKMAGSPLVDRTEAERRAQICIRCPMNQGFAKSCTGTCAELQAVVASVTGHIGTQYDANLHACGICGCFLQSAIHLPLEIQCKGVSDQMKRQFANVPNCWKTCE